MATHSSTLARKIPWTEEPGRLQSMGREESDTTQRLHFSLNYNYYYCVVFSHVWLFASPWTVALQAPLSMGFPRQKYWSGLPFPSPGNFSDPGIEPSSLVSPALAGGFFTTSTTWEAHYYYSILLIGLLPTYILTIYYSFKGNQNFSLPFLSLLATFYWM